MHYIKLIWLCTGLGWFQAAEYLKLVFLEILYVTIWLVFQNLVTYVNTEVREEVGL